MARGQLITFEGIDGSGKSTACRAIASALRARGTDVRERAEPTKTWLGEAVRRGFAEKLNPWSEALLFMADHAEHVLAVERELTAGAIVLCDRWSDSTFAYQGALLAGSAFDAVQWLQDTELAFDHKPDLTLLFDLDARAALQRVAARGGEPEKFERLDILQAVRENYLRLAEDEPERFVVLDASRAPALVLADAAKAVDERTSRR